MKTSKTKTTTKTTKPVQKAKTIKMLTAKTVKPVKKTTTVSKTKTVVLAKRGPGRPKGSKNKAKTEGANDRLQGVFGVDGLVEAGSKPNLKPVPIPKATRVRVENGGVVIEEPKREPSQIMNTVDLPKPKATFDGQSIVMATTPEKLAPAEGERLKATLKDDKGVLIIQEPVRSSN
jgi:hypothetical protein